MTIRFHLDEHVDLAVAMGLRAHGIDVTTSRDAGLLGAEDPQHLAFGLAQGRVVVTHDDDFLRLNAQGAPHAGIAYCHQEARTISEVVQGLLLIHGAMTEDEMRDHVEFL